MSYLEFVDVSSYNPQRKTKTWMVQSTSGAHLGGIRFYPRWRCYVFYPAGETLFNADCLGEISVFLGDNTQAWKKNAG